jgi:hypothetical protein
MMRKGEKVSETGDTERRHNGVNEPATRVEIGYITK